MPSPSALPTLANNGQQAGQYNAVSSTPNEPSLSTKVIFMAFSVQYKNKARIDPIVTIASRDITHV